MTARRALAASGADAVMIGRGAYGRPWLARQIDAALAGESFAEPGPAERLELVLRHFDETLAFYDGRLGVKIFRKHLGWYIEAAPWPADAQASAGRPRPSMCRLETAQGCARRPVEALWSQADALAPRIAA